jgi:hypothetical protein
MLIGMSFGRLIYKTLGLYEFKDLKEDNDDAKRGVRERTLFFKFCL